MDVQIRENFSVKRLPPIKNLIQPEKQQWYRLTGISDQIEDFIKSGDQE